MRQRLRSFYHDTMIELAAQLARLMREGDGMVIDTLTTGSGRIGVPDLEAEYCTVVVYHPAPRYGPQEL